MKSVRKFIGAAAFLALLSAPAAFACAACSGQSDSDMARGMNAGIYALLGVIGAVLSGAVTFFVVLARRSAAVARADHDKNISI